MPKSNTIKLGLSIFLSFAFAALSFAQEIPWQTDLASANEKAAKEGKLVLLHFTADWCRPCKSLETFVFTSPVVENAIDKHVIPVKIDVDLQPDLVSEYGISGVPADVVITPAGRIVTKRNSPTTINGYSAMIKGLGKVLAGLDSGNSALAQEVADLKEQLRPKNIAGKKDFTPKTPSHEAPKISSDGAILARNNSRVLKNPFFQADSDKTAIATTSNNAVVIKNDFEPYTSRRSKEEPAQPSAGVAQAEIKMPSKPAPQQPVATTPQPSMAAAPQQPVTKQPQPTGIALAKIKNQPISNQFFERQQVDSQEANATAQKIRLPSQNQFEPSNTVQTAMSSQASFADSEPVQEIDRSMFALHGKCPVTLMTESRWVDGDQKFGCVHRGRTYLFATKLHLQTFQADPDKFSPLLAGYDPVVYHEQGDLLEGLEENGVFMGKLPNQRIILFSSAATRAQFQRNPREYIETVRQAMLSTNGDGSSRLR